MKARVDMLLFRAGLGSMVDQACWNAIGSFFGLLNYQLSKCEPATREPTTESFYPTSNSTRLLSVYESLVGSHMHPKTLNPKL